MTRDLSIQDFLNPDHYIGLIVTPLNNTFSEHKLTGIHYNESSVQYVYLTVSASLTWNRETG